MAEDEMLMSDITSRRPIIVEDPSKKEMFESERRFESETVPGRGTRVYQIFCGPKTPEPLLGLWYFARGK